LSFLHAFNSTVITTIKKTHISTIFGSIFATECTAF
jgi:hypothetical protein